MLPSDGTTPEPFYEIKQDNLSEHVLFVSFVSLNLPNLSKNSLFMG
jgi:hypothetical protein